MPVFIYIPGCLVRRAVKLGFIKEKDVGCTDHEAELLQLTFPSRMRKLVKIVSYQLIRDYRSTNLDKVTGRSLGLRISLSLPLPVQDLDKLRALLRLEYLDQFPCPVVLLQAVTEGMYFHLHGPLFIVGLPAE